MHQTARTLNRIRDVGIVPVIRADSEENAIRIAEALVESGIGIVEITMTVPNAIGAITSVSNRFGSDILLGAGTITTPTMAIDAIDVGCRFLVTPCLLPEVIATARERHVPTLAGALTPTEIFAATQAGAQLVKVFPAHTAGGAAYIRALKAPFPNVELVPTGGVNLQTVEEFIKAGSAAVGVGGELVLKDAVKRGDFAAIGSLARQFVDAIKRARNS